MERRDFIKISALSGVMATLEGCRSAEKQLIRFIPEEELVPGIATLKPSVCTLCSAGCGLQVRVMQGEAEVVRRGQQGLIKMGLAKKLEGNPQHPVNRGKLCARGQAGLQVLYHPDRITHPIKRTGARGSGEFQEISWSDAIKEVTSHLPTLDLGRADYVISFGADFLGAWNSPVAQSIGYGEMRQGRPGRRAKFVQVESRMYQKGAHTA